MRVELGMLVPALEGWSVCVGECGEGCAVCVYLPEWAEGLGEAERVYVALYLAARATMDYRVVAAAHIYMHQRRVALRPELLARAQREARVESRVPRAIEDGCPYAWQAVLWRGIAYAGALLDLDRPVLARVLPPGDKRGRERLRVIVEGKRVTVKGRTYHVGGLLRALGGRRIAPWLYLVPKRRLPELARRVREAGGEVELIELRSGLSAGMLEAYYEESRVLAGSEGD